MLTKDLELAAGRIPVMVAAAALIDADGRILLQQRPAGKPMAGLWEFPGGKIEAGESPEAALIRELAEELGIATETACLAPATFATGTTEGGDPLILLLFVCRKWQGAPQALHADGLRWERPAAMFALPMPPADRPLIAMLDALL